MTLKLLHAVAVLLALTAPALAQPEPLVQLGAARFRHAGLNDVRFSADGKHVVTASSFPPTLRFWEPATGKLAKEIVLDLQDQFIALAWSGDGKWLANSETLWGDKERAAEHYIRLRAADTGKVVREWPYPRAVGGYPTPPLHFLPNGKELVVHTGAGLVFYEIATGTELLRQKLVRGGYAEFAVAPDGKRIAALATPYAADLLLWDWDSGQPPRDLADSDRVSARAGLFLTLSDRLPAQLWDAQTGRLLHTLAHDRASTGAISPDGKRAATASLDDAIEVWDTATGKLLLQLPGHGRSGGGPVVAFSSDGKHLISCGDDYFLRVTDLASGKAVREFAVRPVGVPIYDDPIQRATMGSPPWPILSPDGSRVLLHGGVFDTTSGQQLQSLTNLGPRSDEAFHHAGARLLRVEYGPTITEKVQGGFRMRRGGPALYSYDLATGEPFWGLPLPDTSERCLAIAPAGRTFALCPDAHARSGRVEFRSLENGGLLGQVEGLPGPVRQMAYLPDGQRLALTLADGTVRVYAVPALRAP